jgi:hypothetical protein
MLWFCFVFPPQFCDVVTRNQTGDDPQEDLATHLIM